MRKKIEYVLVHLLFFLSLLVFAYMFIGFFITILGVKYD